MRVICIIHIDILINGLRLEREIMKPTLMREIQTVGGNHGGINLILKLFHIIFISIISTVIISLYNFMA